MSNAVQAMIHQIKWHRLPRFLKTLSVYLDCCITHMYRHINLKWGPQTCVTFFFMHLLSMGCQTKWWRQQCECMPRVFTCIFISVVIHTRCLVVFFLFLYVCIFYMDCHPAVYPMLCKGRLKNKAFRVEPCDLLTEIPKASRHKKLF